MSGKEEETNTTPRTWSWVGAGIGKDLKTYYQSVMVEEKDGSERTFHVGDCVVIESEVEGFPWIAQVVELYEIGYAQDDDEIQFVGEDMKLAQARMQCTLRWFYYACDKSLKESQRFNKHLPGPVKDEMYFSDHVEVDGNNVVDVIEGLAHMCSSRATMRAMKRDKPRNFCDGDEIRIVRCFYGYGKEILLQFVSWTLGSSPFS